MGGHRQPDKDHKNAAHRLVESENKRLREWVTNVMKDPPDVPFIACDNSCMCAAATGMSTNGGCRCNEQKLRQAVQYWRSRAQHLQKTIILQRDGDPIKEIDDNHDMYLGMMERQDAREKG